MARSEKFWRGIISDFIPVGPLRPADVQRCFVDRYENDPTESILVKLKAGLFSWLEQPKPYQALLTGCRGSGKSSELVRLAQEVAEEFFVVWFDPEAWLNDNTANQFDILLGIGLSVHKAGQMAGMRPSAKMTEKLLNRKCLCGMRRRERLGRWARKLHAIL